jgi:hypothetical protein
MQKSVRHVWRLCGRVQLIRVVGENTDKRHCSRSPAPAAGIVAGLRSTVGREACNRSGVAITFRLLFCHTRKLLQYFAICIGGCRAVV